MNKAKTKKRRRGNAVSQFYWEIGRVYGQVERTKKFLECLEERIEKIFTTYQNDFNIEPLQVKNMQSHCGWYLADAAYRLDSITNVINCLKKNLDKEALSHREANHREKENNPQANV